MSRILLVEANASSSQTRSIRNDRVIKNLHLHNHDLPLSYRRKGWRTRYSVSLSENLSRFMKRKFGIVFVAKVELVHYPRGNDITIHCHVVLIPALRMRMYLNNRDARNSLPMARLLPALAVHPGRRTLVPVPNVMGIRLLPVALSVQANVDLCRIQGRGTHPDTQCYED
ncbi:hypothetical protein PoB_000289100 [Plakobranchus ocellatus]|uniref:Uncharacterized protein n=1 Tax=Plakobranchus ocellatus TaxID=259542 RepID=A0AAV3XEL0_9GAST|nr:hypothetical protein PoB_000289100 [Plakobranchus ocellatus]